MDTDNMIIKALRSGIETKEKQGKKYYFSVYAVLPGDENKKGLPVIEYGKGLEDFDEAIEKALSFHPEKIIVVDHKNKTDSRRMSKEHLVNLSTKVNEKDILGNLVEIMNNNLQEGLKKLETKLDNESQEGGLGMISEQFKHAGERLRWNTESQLAEMRHQKQVEDLQRQISKLEEQHLDDENYISELETANKDWENTYEELKNNRLKFNGVDGKELIGELIGKGLTGFVKQNIGTVAKLSGMPPEVLAEAISPTRQGAETSQIMEEETDPQLEALMSQIKSAIRRMDEQYIQPFIQIVGAVAQDNSLVLKLMKII
jgi:phage host-nuclease inhibitor protein Gam